MAFSIPDYFFDSFDRITPAFLTEHGIRCILCDIDNTLVTYDDAEPTEAVRNWLNTMRENRITVIFLSNNNGDRARIFANSLPNPYYAPASKPLTKTAKRALSEHGFTKNETAVLGDQIFTDVWAGNFLGAALTLLVPPIKDKTNLFFRTKRLLEKPFLRCYRRREKKRQTREEV
ncbi:MAG: YqeG family HAD IIIA-type phosphatase [Clostridia bacterium]|nr:YqeG family HAD IIIA-type phosphatase [Clostridia bacterium]